VPELDLPPEFAPISTPPPYARPPSTIPVKAILGLLAILLAGALLLRHAGDDQSAGAVKEQAQGETLHEAQSALVAQPERAAAVPVPAPAPRPVRAVRAAFPADAPARKLLGEANRKLAAQDLPGAIELYEQALVLKPHKHVLAAAYRGLGAAFTRQGNVEEGAHYYKLYLPLCGDPAEKAQLQKLLDDYAARRR